MNRVRWGEMPQEVPSAQARLQGLSRNNERLRTMRDVTTQGRSGWSSGSTTEVKATTSHQGYSLGESLDDEAGTSHQTEVSSEHVSSDQTLTQDRPDLSYPDSPTLEDKLEKYKKIGSFTNKHVDNLYKDTLNDINALYPTFEEKLQTFLLIRSKPSEQLPKVEHHLGLVLRKHLQGEVTEEQIENVRSQEYFQELRADGKRRVYNALGSFVRSNNS